MEPLVGGGLHYSFSFWKGFKIIKKAGRKWKKNHFLTPCGKNVQLRNEVHKIKTFCYVEPVGGDYLCFKIFSQESLQK